MSIVLSQTANERLALIKADELARIASESKEKSDSLLNEFEHWANVDPLSPNLDSGLSIRSGFAELKKKVFKIRRTRIYDISAAIQTIASTALNSGYKTFGADNEYVPYVIIGYEDEDINTVINSESLQPNKLAPADLFKQVSARVTTEEDQAVVLFAAQVLKILNSGVCNLLQIIIPPEYAIMFCARYQSILETAGFILIQTMEGYKILFNNPGNYELPCQLSFSSSLTAVKLMRNDKIDVVA